MSLAESLVREFSQEAATTRKLLERLPEDKLDFRPHPKSMTMGRLASHIAEIPRWAEAIVEAEGFDMDTAGDGPADLGSRQAILELFERTARGLETALAGRPDEHLLAVWRLSKGGATILELPRLAALRSFVLSHGIHHRGQLSVYLRLTDVPVPSIYGPSADES